MTKNALILMAWIIIFGSCQKEEKKSKVLCTEYDWIKVLGLVQPYLNDFSNTALVMQGQSSEYNTSAAARHALSFKEQLSDSIITQLESIENAECNSVK